jgi:predicted O-methyltransferase YrrM
MVEGKKILEIGTAIGYSALIFEEAIVGKGKITSIEINEEKAEIARKNIAKYKKKDSVDIEVLTGDALDILPEINEKYDIVFIDAGKSHYIKYFDLTNKLLEKNGVIISDNVLYKGMISSDHLVVKRKRTIVRNMREYIDYIVSKDNFFTTILPLGDGIAISKKIGDESHE